MKRREGSIHNVAIVAGVAIGNSLIRYPWHSHGGELFPRFLLFAICAALPALVFYPFFQWLYRGPLSRKKAKCALAVFFSLALGFYACFAAWQSATDYVRYAGDLILTDAQEWLLAAAFLLVAACLGQISTKGRRVFSLLAVLASLLCAVLLFVFGIRYFQFDRLSLLAKQRLPSLSPLLPDLLWESCLPFILLSAYFALTNFKGGKGALIFGAGIGYAALLLCVLQTLLTFGTDYAGELSYPYAQAVRVISVGPYFFRLEGFSYLLDYTACLLRVGIFLAAAKRLMGRFLPHVSRYLPITVAVFLFTVMLLR